MTYLILALGLGLVGVIGLWLLETAIERPYVGVALILIATVVELALASSKPAVFIGSYRVNVADMVFVVIVAAAVARLLRVPLTGPQRLLILLGIMALFALARGMGDFGVEAAVNEFRRYMRFIGGALYVSTFSFSREQLNRVARAWIVAAVVVCGVAMLRWVESFTGIRIGPLSAEYGTVIRSISGTETYFVATGFLVSVVAWRSQALDTQMRWMSGFLALMVVLLNRRTVWLALLAGLGLVMLRDRALGRRLVALSLAATAVTAVVLVSLPSDAVEEPLVKGTTDTGTLLWRVEGWAGLIESGPSTPSEWLAGQPFGSGFEREVSNRTLESNPHSYYLETFLRLGLVGSLALIALYVWVARPLLQSRPGLVDHYLGSDTLLVVLASHLVWFATWSPGYEQGVLLGLAMSAAAGASASADPRTPKVRVGLGFERSSGSHLFSGQQ